MSNTGGPTTWFSGKSAPEDQQGPSPLLLIGAAFLLYSPLGALATLGCYVAFNYYRVSHKVIAGCAALYGIPYLVGTFLFSSPAQAVMSYNKPWARLFTAIRHKDTDGFLAHNWWFWFTHQIWLSLALGLVFGTVWTSWKWVRRPAWEDNERIPGPVHRLRRRRAVRDIASDINGPLDGATVGVDEFGNRIVQTEREAAAHTLLAGGSGAGKTTTMMVGIRDSIRRGEPVCVVDLKGAADLPVQLAEWCERYGRRFLHWSITDRRLGYHGPADGPAFYDPIGRGDPSRKKDLLIGSEKWDVEYYKSVNENYLQTAFQIAELVPNPQVDAFTDLAALLDTDKLKTRAAALFVHVPKNTQGQQHANAHGMGSHWWDQYPTVLDPYVQSTLSAAADMLMKPEESERSAIRNMAARVQKLRQSTAGAWLKRDPHHGRDIDLRKVADEGWVVVFSLDSSNYKATSQQVGGLIIQDLNTLSSELRANPAPRPFHIYVDEFSAIGQDNILDLLARARDARMPTMLSTQALADLKKADNAFLDQALGIVNCFMIHRANTEADAEIFAGLTGKRLKWIQRMGVEKTSGLPGGIGTGAGTGQGTIEQQEDYVVLPSEFQALKQGELVYIAKSPTARVVHPVTVIREDELKVAHAVATGAAPLLQAAPRFAVESPFTEAEEDLSEALPSPWPVMAADVEADEDDATDLPQDDLLDDEDDDEEVTMATPVPLDKALAPTPVPMGGYAAENLAQFEGPGKPMNDPVTESRAAKEPAQAPPAVDPAEYRTDIPTISFAPTTPEPAPQITAPEQPASPVVSPAPVPAPPQAPARHEPEPDQQPPAPSQSPVPPSVSEEEDDEFAFGGGDVEWEQHAGDWQAENLGVPIRAPKATPRRAEGSGTKQNLPTTTETPKRPMPQPDEWSE